MVLSAIEFFEWRILDIRAKYEERCSGNTHISMREIEKRDSALLKCLTEIEILQRLYREEAANIQKVTISICNTPLTMG